MKRFFQSEDARDFGSACTATVVIAALCGLLSCTTFPSSSNTRRVSFESEIKPLLEARCVACHTGQTLEGGDLVLTSRDLAFRHSPNGPFFAPGHPEQSKLFLVVGVSEATPGAMPPVGHRLSAEEVTLLKQWIAQGADWPSGSAGNLSPASPNTH